MGKRKTLYEETYQKMQMAIKPLNDGIQLDSIETLCEKFGASRTLIREVLAALEREGLVVRRQGLGTFVTKEMGHVHTGIEYLRGLNKIISTSGKTPGLAYDTHKILEADNELAERLEIKRGEKVVLVDRLYTADGIPAIFARTYIASERIEGGTERLCAHLDEITAKELVLFDLLEEIYGESVKYAFAEIESGLIDDELSALMEMENGSAITILKEIHRTKEDTPLLYSEDYINTNVFKIHIIRKKI
ncbi:MAG TPA: UTRA domain-containing protein [Thermotogota bacterium]|nr:UTRA domain-containing protein [Thermotogota bacterium]HPJ90005.1 UTRA domain-containing protein [Thermotogota bacterium]HPR97055.1 UTRA domain-containing protein [Thermotogota bacterium]